MNTNHNITRLIINFFITLFVIVVILTVILLVLYYLTPNNYIIELYNKTKHNLIKEYIVNIKPNTSILVPMSDSNKYMINFLILKKNVKELVRLEDSVKSEDFEKSINKNELNLLVKNIFKSQSIIISQDYIIKTKYESKIIILNTNECSIDVKISLFN
jgi:hypothetical protein